MSRSPAADPAAERPDTADWFPFTPDEDHGPSVIGLEEWLDAPAGRRGPVRQEGDRFVFADGTRARFWGVNHGNANCAPPKEVAEKRAKRLAKYGVNAVRLHKFTWHGDGAGIGAADVSTRLTDEGWDRLDYYVSRLKERGIYHGWSHIFGHRLRPGDRSRVRAYDEVMNAHGASYLRGSTYGLVLFAPDLQDLSIELTVHMLQHRGRYTGLRYADEPALCFIEMQNEDDIFFPSTHDAVMKCPTYKKLLCEQFTNWVLKKYGSAEAADKAWGPKALNAYPEAQTGESWAARNVYPFPHQWYHGPDGLADAEKKGTKRRMLDAARFLYETQDRFYKRFADAIRRAGYRGPLVGSCWQAGEGVSHYYNLLSDANVGFIDRHNYFGGQGDKVARGKNDNRAMLASPGSGLLSTGLQQVKGRPFAISEWTSLVPNEWVAEGPALVAVYGMGLQGWDASYEFANDLDAFSPTIQTHGPWVVDSPTQIGMYPAWARLVHRCDVSEGTPLPPRAVSEADLLAGTLGFGEKLEQSGGMGDQKSFAGTATPPEALAVGRVRVEFSRRPAPTRPVDLSSARDASGRALRSTTGQLTWHTPRPGEGWFTVDTPGTKGVVGWAPGGRPLVFGDGVSITPGGGFALVLVSALGKAETVRNARGLLVSVIARARNTGMRYAPDGSEVLEVGKAPVLLEPVRATLAFGGRPPSAVHILDHDGRRTGRTLPIEPGGAVQLDTGRDRALYYEIALRA